MIGKANGGYRVNKLCTILLDDADFNMNDKYLGQEVMKKAEKGQVLAKAQYGSKKIKAEIVHALYNRFTFDILLQ